ncbi:MAG: hypothetical protein ACI33P_11345 [Lysinibacillus sp.]
MVNSYDNRTGNRPIPFCINDLVYNEWKYKVIIGTYSKEEAAYR